MVYIVGYLDFQLTYSANEKRDHKPSPRAEHLVGVEYCCNAEKNDEDDGCWHGRFIIVFFERRTVVASRPSVQVVHRCVGIS